MHIVRLGRPDEVRRCPYGRLKLCRFLHGGGRGRMLSDRNRSDEAAGNVITLGVWPAAPARARRVRAPALRWRAGKSAKTRPAGMRAGCPLTRKDIRNA
jgi:hypothetical protein